MGDTVQHSFGDTSDVAALDAGVVLRTDASQGRDLLPPQPRHPAAVTEGAQPSLLGGDSRTAADQELPDLRTKLWVVGHVIELRPARLSVGDPVKTRSEEHTSELQSRQYL